MDLFDFEDYKDYLREALGGAKKRTGLKAQAAKAMDIQTAYLSQVLNGDTHLNLEQSQRLNRHLGHSKEASHYFLLLVQKARAGTADLAQYFAEQVEILKQHRREIKNRVNKSGSISKEDQAKYYSSWQYGAVHMALMLPELRHPQAISRYLGIPVETVQRVLDFLVKAALVKEEDGYRVGSSLIHLGRDSDNIIKHHTNWRLKALESLSQEKINDLHYSVLYCMSQADALKIKDRLLNVIQENLEIVAPSPEEALYCQTLDFFALG